jgi:hypothetical protein
MADVERRAVEHIAGPEFAVDQFGEVVEPVQIVFGVADDKNIICLVRHKGLVGI